MFPSYALLAVSCFYLGTVRWLPGIFATTCSLSLFFFHFFMKNDSIDFSHRSLPPSNFIIFRPFLDHWEALSVQCNGALKRAEASDLGQIKIGFPTPLWGMVKMNIKKIYEGMKQRRSHKSNWNKAECKPRVFSLLRGCCQSRKSGDLALGVSSPFSPLCFPCDTNQPNPRYPLQAWIPAASLCL